MTGTPLGALAQRLGIELAEASAERVVGTMPVDGNTQPYGLLHGGASCVLAETLGSIGAALGAPEGRLPVGVDLNATHHRAARSGTVTGHRDAAAPGADHRDVGGGGDRRAGAAGLHRAADLRAADGVSRRRIS